MSKSKNQNDMPESASGWTAIEPWMRLSLIPGLGITRLQRLLAQFGTPEKILAASEKELAKGIPEKVAQTIVKEQDSHDIKQKLNTARGWQNASNAHHILCPDSRLYPIQLKELPDPPAVLYVLGNPVLLSEPQIAVVGSRRPTPQGRTMATEMASQLTRSGFVVTSGMAMGIDGAAHQGAIASYGDTIAVLGTGIDQIYPRSHRSLYASIIQQGAIVSEYAIGTAPKPANFPRRNRIISGLSLGVLVVEAALQSGSLISARLAAEQGKEVFAMPSSVMNPMAKGCHQLIKEGAVLVETVDDILAELKPQVEQILLKTDNKAPSFEDINPVQQKILSAMGYDVINPDLLCSLCAMSYSELSVLLTNMELNGMIEAVPGGYIRIS
ncbi:MAG: DNA-processing protein DprA [Endozoicomonas sp. (ex Botrylloides leachii)]|nr:DNA-processing protein DprA [Endozoicomonas sp. (ex Botrylloides leachii)]